MNALRNMKIASKIVSILVLATIALLAVGGVGYYFMKQMNQMSTEMYEVRMTKVNYLNDMRRLSRSNEAATYEIFLANNPTAQRAALDESRKLAEDLDKIWANYKKMNLDTYEKEREAKYEQLLVQYRQIRQQAVDMAQAGQSAAAYALFKTQAERPLEDVNTVRRELSNYNTEQSKKLAVATDDFFSKATMYMAGIAVLAVFLCFAFGLMVSRMVSRALQQLTDVANKMAVGDVNVKIQKDSKDETGILAEAFDVMANNIRNAANAAERISAGDLTVNVKVLSDKDILGKSLDQCVTNVKLLVADAEMLSVAAVQGKLDTRADASKHGGDFRKIVEGVNKTLDSVIGPLNVAAEYVDRISKGDIPPKITDNYNGDFNEIKNNLNQAIDAVNALVADATMLSVAAVEGKLDTRADASKHGGDFRKIVEGVNKTLDSVIGPLNVAAEYVDRISKGDIPPKITDNYNGDFNEIKNNLNQAIDAVNALVADAAMLSVAAVEGKLDTRADASKHGGDFRKIVEGVNKTLDAVIGPLNVAAEYVDRISKGDIPPKITDNYNGDFNEIKNNLNNCIDNLNGLIGEMKHMSDEHDRGDIDVIIEAAKFQGAYKVMGEGVNNMVNGHIAVKKKAMACVSEFGRGNFEAPLEVFPGKKVFINQTIEQVRENLKALITDTNMLVVAAVEGKLDTRADASKHQGDFRKIVEGVNKTLDSVIGPLNVAAEYVDRISKGDIPPKITDTYNGDFNEIKNNLNSAIDNINALVIDANMLVEAAIAGKLATRADATKHGGDFRKIVEGVNKTLDSVIGPLNVAADYVDKISRGEIPAKITDTYNGDFNTIKNNLNQAIDAVNALVADAGMLVTAAIEGKLATRADATKHQGDYRKIVEGVNKTLDSVIGPLNVAADYVDKISRGNMPPVITDNYNGDFNTIKNNLNRCIEAVNGLIAESVTLSRAAVEGRLQTRGKADKFEGGYREIVQGVNDTLDAVLKPIEEAADCLKEMANGNLNVEVKGNYQGDHAIIKDALNGTIDAMNDILGQVSMAVEQVSAGSREIATSSQALSQGATESASAVEEISASMQEMGSQTNQNAENATQANQLAVLARDNAEKGNGQMTQMVKAMGDINQSANNISKIIKVIDEIAFQTNLLALNAAVEAARAGKHGKGFTVVAEEVRNLAQRSAKAAKETTEMIEDSIKRTEIGTTIAENTSKALEEIVVGATKVTDLISEIAAASKEQAQGIGQINNGLGQVDQVTQQNTASAEEMASAGEELSSQSLQLKQMLAKFQLKKAAGSHLGGGYGGGYGADHFDAGPSARQSNSRQRVDVPWGGTPAKAGRKNARGGEVKPEEIISLDDQHFGKF
jgi:methyl-accepting chemotaxis protein